MGINHLRGGINRTHRADFFHLFRRSLRQIRQCDPILSRALLELNPIRINMVRCNLPLARIQSVKSNAVWQGLSALICNT